MDLMIGSFDGPSEEKVQSAFEESPELFDTNNLPPLFNTGQTDLRQGHKYLEKSEEISLEFFLLLLSLSLLIVRYANPYWFTSRAFTLVFSTIIFLSGFQLLVDVSAISVLYKVNTVGIILPGGLQLDKKRQENIIIPPMLCVAMSGVNMLTTLVSLMALNAYGEGLFDKTIINYYNLVKFGEFHGSKGSSFENKSSSCQTLDPDPYRINNSSDDTYDAIQGPVLIAVTTKFWHPPAKSNRLRRNSQSVSNLQADGKSLGNHSMSNNTESSKTLMKFPSVHFWPCVFAVISFMLNLITKACLIRPMLKLYWDTGCVLGLAHIIVSVMYLIVYLVAWFGLCTKTAWRFRLIHLLHDDFRPSDNGLSIYGQNWSNYYASFVHHPNQGNSVNAQSRGGPGSSIYGAYNDFDNLDNDRPPPPPAPLRVGQGNPSDISDRMSPTNAYVSKSPTDPYLNTYVLLQSALQNNGANGQTIMRSKNQNDNQSIQYALKNNSSLRPSPSETGSSFESPATSNNVMMNDGSHYMSNATLQRHHKQRRTATSSSSSSNMNVRVTFKERGDCNSVAPIVESTSFLGATDYNGINAASPNNGANGSSDSGLGFIPPLAKSTDSGEQPIPKPMKRSSSRNALKYNGVNAYNGEQTINGRIYRPGEVVTLHGDANDDARLCSQV